MSKPNQTFDPFMLDTEAVFPWPVVVKVPDPNRPGVKVPTKFIAVFKHVSEERRIEIIQEHRDHLRELQRSEEDQRSDDDHQLGALFSLSQRVLDEVLVRCERIVDRERKPLEWTDAVKRALVTHQMVWPALFKSYQEAITQEDRKGN